MSGHPLKLCGHLKKPSTIQRHRGARSLFASCRTKAISVKMCKFPCFLVSHRTNMSRKNVLVVTERCIFSNAATHIPVSSTLMHASTVARNLLILFSSSVPNCLQHVSFLARLARAPFFHVSKLVLFCSSIQQSCKCVSIALVCSCLLLCFGTTLFCFTVHTILLSSTPTSLCQETLVFKIFPMSCVLVC